MKDANRATYVTREHILSLLSDEEVARISTAETMSGLSSGEEYLDLEHVDRGVQRAGASTNVKVGNVLPRSAVHQATWSKVIAQLAS